MAWIECREKFTNAKLDESLVARRLRVPRDEVSERLHSIKRSVGLRGQAVGICLDDGEVYMLDPPHAPIGNLRD